MNKILWRLQVLVLFIATNSAFAQKPEDVYKQPLTDVLAQVEKTYQVQLNYNQQNLKGLMVDYATWRFTSDVKNTLTNILLPLNLAYNETGSRSYEITPYEYYRRSDAEGKKHLDKLLSLYANAAEFDQRKNELRTCILQTLGINLQ